MAHYGGRFVGTYSNPQATAITRSFPVATVTITKGDFVYWSSGFITSGTGVTGAKLIGVADETVTGDSSTVYCRVIVNPDALYLVDNDNDGTTFAASHRGTYFDLAAVATGVQQVDTSTTTTTGSLICIEYNPQIEPYLSDTSMGLFMIAENATFGRYA